jgi:protein-tyrosine phosphatase
MRSILFVCTANQCRSPMAAALFQNLVEQKKLPGPWKIESAGTWAAEGYPAVTKTRLALAKWGMDISNHRSRRVTGELIRTFDLVLTMEAGQKEALQAEYPDWAEHIYLLGEMAAGQMEEIPDPIGGPLQDFENIAARIETCLELGVVRILALSQNMGELD